MAQWDKETVYMSEDLAHKDNTTFENTGDEGDWKTEEQFISKWIKLENGTTAFKLLSEGKKQISAKYSTESVVFEVETIDGEEKYISLGSKKILRELQAMGQLKGKMIMIAKSGQGMDTKYDIKELSNNEWEKLKIAVGN